MLLGKVSSWTEVRKETRKLSKKERKRKEEEELNTSIFARLKDQGLDPTHYKRYELCLFGYFPYLGPWKWHWLSLVVTLNGGYFMYGVNVVF